jgi:hypothetical protein
LARRYNPTISRIGLWEFPWELLNDRGIYGW